VLFPHAHIAHPDWRAALPLLLAQLQGLQQRPGYARSATLGLVYITEVYAPHAEAILAELKLHTGVAHWAGCSAVGVAANGAEYLDEGAIAVMLCDFPADAARVFSGIAPLKGAARAALVHADPSLPEMTEMIAELAARTSTGYTFGGVASGRGTVVQFADGVHSGGLSGVAFSDALPFISRVTQGSQPIARSRIITRAERNVVYELDGEPALSVLFGELGLDERDPRRALPALREVLVGLTSAQLAIGAARARPGQLGEDTRVRHLVGIDAQNKGVAIADTATLGDKLQFCARNRDAARRDLVRICAEIRSELEPEDLPLAPAAAPATVLPTLLPAELSEPQPTPQTARNIRGAVYVSCAGRGGPHFGAPNAELKIIQQQLGDVPLVGFFASGEIARNQLVGYTGVLTCFV
jgi:small ligand-binding sensory domain FIST